MPPAADASAAADADALLELPSEEVGERRSAARGRSGWTWSLGLAVPAAVAWASYRATSAPGSADRGPLPLAWLLDRASFGDGRGTPRRGSISWSEKPSQCLSVDTNRPDPGSLVYLDGCNDGIGQRFSFRESGQIHWQGLHNLCLSTTDDHHVVLAQCGNRPEQQFMMFNGRSGHPSVSSHTIHFALDISQCITVDAGLTRLRDCDSATPGATHFNLPGEGSTRTSQSWSGDFGDRHHSAQHPSTTPYPEAPAASDDWLSPIAGLLGIHSGGPPVPVDRHHHGGGHDEHRGPLPRPAHEAGRHEPWSQQPQLPPQRPQLPPKPQPLTDEHRQPLIAHLPPLPPHQQQHRPAAHRGPAHGLTSFYVYRAWSHEEYPPENINVGDLAGVLYYLHNEVVTTCPRKYDITRIKRLKLTFRVEQLGHFVAFDQAKCTVPNCDRIWEQHGFVVGCQQTPAWCHRPPGLWLSLPGPCPSERARDKTAACSRAHPGGRCDHVTGHSDCTYSVEEAGEVALNDLVGIQGDYDRFCASGQREYVKHLGKGIGVDFWDGYGDPAKCDEREERVKQAFARAFPSMPSELDVPPLCDGSGA